MFLFAFCQRDSRRHLALGKGVHFCLGAPLGRLEELVPLLDPGSVLETDPPMIDSFAVRGRSRLLLQAAQHRKTA